MPTQTERLAVVEIKVANIEEKVGEIKTDLKDVHDCLDRTRDLLDSKLEVMLNEYRENRDKFYTHADTLHKENRQEHSTLATKINELEKQKNKITLAVVVGLAFIAGAGWSGAINFPMLLKFFGF
jgi:ABC-type siderophore export system fused ATPase/permease subunit